MAKGRGSAAAPGCPMASLISDPPFLVGSGRRRGVPRRLATAPTCRVLAPIGEADKRANLRRSIKRHVGSTDCGPGRWRLCVVTSAPQLTRGPQQPGQQAAASDGEQALQRACRTVQTVPSPGAAGGDLDLVKAVVKQLSCCS